MPLGFGNGGPGKSWHPQGAREECVGVIRARHQVGCLAEGGLSGSGLKVAAAARPGSAQTWRMLPPSPTSHSSAGGDGKQC